MGHALPTRREAKSARSAASEFEALPWEVTPPDWRAILAWRDSKRKESLETQQKALVWLAWYWGQGGNAMPPFLARPWASHDAVHRAQRENRMRKIERYLSLPNDVSKLLGAKPYEEKFRACGVRLKRHSLQLARYKDTIWRTMILLGVYTGPRASEYTTLEIGMVRPDLGGIRAWPQPKKGMAPRDATFTKEDWLWHESTASSVTSYLKTVRPKVARSANARDPVFLTSEGKPFTDNGVRNFIREGMALVLGDDARGPHSLRRACATWRYHCGWDLDEVALLLDDDPAVIKRSYIDWAWIRHAGRENERSRTRTPPAKRILPMVSVPQGLASGDHPGRGME